MISDKMLGGWDTSEIVLSDGTVLPAGKTTQGWAFRSANLQGLTDTQIDCIIQYMNGNLDYIP